MKSSFAVSEKNYKSALQKQVLPYFYQGDQRTFINPEGMKLNFHSFLSSQNKKTIVILPGRSEPALKYAELVYDLKDSGYNIYVLDHQGQGASERHLKDTHKGHVKVFVNYVRDFSKWLDEVVIPETRNQERFLVAHSMGAVVGSVYLAYGKESFKKAVFSAPMMELNTKPYKEEVARVLSGTLTLARLGSNYAPDRGPYLASNDTFEKNEVTHSKARFEMAKEIFVTKPELAVGGPTNRWVHQSLITTKRIDTIAGKIKIPVLMFQSGMDLIVKPGRQNAFCKTSPACTMIRFPDAHHEILQETDAIRNKALDSLKNFIK